MRQLFLKNFFKSPVINIPKEINANRYFIVFFPFISQLQGFTDYPSYCQYSRVKLAVLLHVFTMTSVIKVLIFCARFYVNVFALHYSFSINIKVSKITSRDHHGDFFSSVYNYVQREYK